MTKSTYNIQPTTYNKGFTLIELLVVISIIGVLAALSLISFTGSQKQARDTQRKSDLKQYQTALEGYANKSNGFYPSRSNLTISSTSTTLCTDMGLTGCPVDPKDPTLTYKYWSDGGGTGSATGTLYVLWGTLENTTGYWVVCSSGKVGLSASAPSSSACPI